MGEYTVSPAWNVSNAVYAGNEFLTFSVQNFDHKGVWFKPDGLILYMMSGDGIVYEYFCTNGAWNITGMTYSGVNKFAGVSDAAQNAIQAKDDGTRLYSIGQFAARNGVDDINFEG